MDRRLGGGGSTVSRYRVGELLASGGMATVHIAQVHGAAGFSRVVAMKRMLPHLAADSNFASMFCDEARLAARVNHPNVVSTFDVVMDGTELCIVMEYVHGITLSELGKRVKAKGERIPPSIGMALVRDALQGLHAAHETVDDDGRPLGIVHRDVSPQNVLVGADGIARVLDFGIAKANARLVDTRTGDALKGKLSYMAPEQLEGKAIDRSCDVFAASVLLWEVLTGERLHGGTNEGEIVTKILLTEPPPPSSALPALGGGFDEVVLRGLARAPADRHATARDMALALSHVGECAPAARVAEWVEATAGDVLAARASQIKAFVRGSPAHPTEAAASEHATAYEATGSAIAALPTPSSRTAAEALPVVKDTAAVSRVAKHRARNLLLGVLAGAAAVGAIASIKLLASDRGATAAGASATVAPSPPPQPAASSTPEAAPSPSSVMSSAPEAASAAPAPSARVVEPRRQTRGVRRTPAPAIPDHL